MLEPEKPKKQKDFSKSVDEPKTNNEKHEEIPEKKEDKIPEKKVDEKTRISENVIKRKKEDEKSPMKNWFIRNIGNLLAVGAIFVSLWTYYMAPQRNIKIMQQKRHKNLIQLYGEQGFKFLG